jgi:AAA domain
MTLDLEPMTVPEVVQLARRSGIKVAGYDDNGRVDADGGYALEPLDWRSAIENGVPPIDYVDEPYLPRGARVWVWGATGTAKSIWALWTSCRLTRAGVRVAYFSEENPLAEDLRRLSLLKPDPAFLAFFHRTGIDLTDPLWVASVLKATEACGVVVFDTLTDCWHGDENSNEEIRNFDTTVQKPLQAQGCTPIVVHHSGHPQMFSNRKGATAGRGASSLGQKADVTLDFQAEASHRFTIVWGKSRIGGTRVPDRTFEVADTQDGIDIVEVATPHEDAVSTLIERAVSAITTAPAGYLTTTGLRAVMGGRSDTQRDVLDELEHDERVQVTAEKVKDARGRMREAKVWRPNDGAGRLM